MEAPERDAGSRTRDATPPPPPEPEDLGEVIARVAAGGRDLEGLTRPLLEALSKLARLESTYLMVFDWTKSQQEVLYAFNSGGADVAEGMRVAIAQGLSPQALPGVTRSLETLPEAHPDSQVARELGLRTYVSVPVVVAKHQLWGMLCGASRAPRQVAEDVITVMEFLSQLIADHVVREQTAATERRAEAAEATLRARAVFLAQAEHEMKTPLTIIVGMARTLEGDWETLTDEERTEFLSTLNRHAGRLSGQVENLLVEARAEVRARSLVPEEVELNQVLRATARAFDEASPDHRVLGGDTERVRAVVDESALHQVLGLLLDNAVKYSTGGGTIRLVARRVGGRAVVEIVDEGIGVPEDIDIFAPFQRGPQGEIESPGVGLGLHIVRNLVEAMGGSVRARRNPDRGSTFVITLPAR
jgi:signal transduction histidine kinase